MRSSFSKNAKWLSDVGPATPVTKAARVALGARLAAVRHYLRQATRHPRRDAEDVHQLRVATRRAMAAYEVFAPLVPPKRGRWLAKQLRQLRRAAGEARDWDVFLLRLPQMVEDPQSDPARGLKRAALRHRRQSQAPMTRAAAKWDRPRSEARRRRLLKRIRLPLVPTSDGPSASGFAAAAVEGMHLAGERVFAAIVDERAAIAELHQFRIAAKQLRYAMELFASGFDRSFRDGLYPRIEQLQERLGKINDHAAAVERLAQWQKEFDDPALIAEIDRLIARERQSLIEARSAFHLWWTPPEQMALREAFRHYLGASPVAGRIPPAEGPPDAEGFRCRGAEGTSG